MTSTLLQSIEAKEQLENILVAINKALPNQEPILKELSKYSQSKDQFIKRLQQNWYERDLPVFTELQVRQMNSAYYSEKAKKQCGMRYLGPPFYENWSPDRDYGDQGQCISEQVNYATQFKDRGVRYWYLGKDLN